MAGQGDETRAGAGTITHRQRIPDDTRIDPAHIGLQDDPSEDVDAEMTKLAHRERRKPRRIGKDVHDAEAYDARGSGIADRFEHGHRAGIDVRRTMDVRI